MAAPADASLPISTVTVPGNLSYVNFLATISGTASIAPFPGAATISYSSVSIQINPPAGNYWNGSGFVSVTQIFVPTVFSGASSGTWSDSVGLPAWVNGTTYQLQSWAQDSTGGVQAGPGSTQFTFDNQPPISAITSPSNAAYVNGGPLIMGTAADNVGLSTVTLSIQDTSVAPPNCYNQTLNNFGATCPNWFPASGAPATWSYGFGSAPVVTGHTYVVKSSATDLAANAQSLVVSSSFTVDTVLPSMAVLAPPGLPAPGSSGPSLPTISGTAADDSGVSSVGVSISSSPNFSTFWNGSFWVPGAPIYLVASGTAAWVMPGVPSGSNLAPGANYKITPQATDLAGNVTLGASITYNFTGWAPGCAVGFNVKQDGSMDFPAIGLAVSSMSTTLSGGDACVVIRDTQTYNEQVTIRNFTNNGFKVRIMADPSFISSAPVVSPLAASTAAFVIANASVTISGINIAPAFAITYGVNVSSPNVTISSVNIQDASGKITSAGVAVTSYTTVSYSSVTVGAASSGAIMVQGAGTSIFYSSGSTSLSGGLALQMNNSSSNNINHGFFSNTSGCGSAVYATGISNYNTVSNSAIDNSASGCGNEALRIDGATNTVSGCTISAGGGCALSFNVGSSYNMVSQSTMTNGSSFYGALCESGVYNTVTQSYAGGPASTPGAVFNATASSNTISQSTITRLTSSAAALMVASGSRNNNLISDSITNANGNALEIDGTGNVVSQSTMTSNAGAFQALYLNGGSLNTVAQSFINNPVGIAAAMNLDVNDTITRSTITSNGGPGQAVYVSTGLNDTIDTSYVQGQQAISNSGSTGTVIDGSYLLATNLIQKSLFSFGAVNLTVTTNTIVGGPLGAGVFLDIGNSGTLNFTSNTVTATSLGVNIKPQAAGAILSITSMTFSGLSPGATAINFTAGSFASTFSGVGFFDPNIAVNVNASGLFLSTITMRNVSGLKAGPLFANDPFAEVVWPGMPTTTVNPIQAQPYVGSLANFSGMAQAYNGNSVSAVSVAVQRLSDGLYWNAPSGPFNLATPSFYGAAGFPAWSNAAGPGQPALTAGATYQILVKVTDSANVSAVTTAGPYFAMTFLNSGNFASPGGFVNHSNNNFQDLSPAVVVDNTGTNIYEVAFSSTSSSFGAPVLESLIKLDGGGNLLNTAFLGGNQGNVALALDSANLYVSDQSSGPAGKSITLTTYNTSALIPMTSITLDTTVIGNVTRMVSDGTFLYTINDGGSVENHAKLIKYNSSLIAQATATYTGGTATNNGGDAIALDPVAGNVWVAVSTGSNPGSERHLLKYPSAFNLAAPSKDTTITPRTPLQPSVAVSTDGALVYTGYYGLGGGSVYIDAYSGVTGLYTGQTSTTTGALAPFGNGRALVGTAPNGVVYEAYTDAYDGVTYPGHGDYQILKFSRDLSTFLLSQNFNGVGNSTDVAFGMAVVDSSHVVVTGLSWNGADYDAVTVKRDLTGASGGQLTVQAADLAPSTVGVTGANVPMLRLALWTQFGPMQLGSIKPTLAGNAPAANVSATWWGDPDGDGVFQPTDTVISSGVFIGGAPPSVTLSTTGLTINATTQYFFLTVNFSSMAAGNQIGLSIPDLSYFGANTGYVANQPIYPIQSSTSNVQQYLFANPAAGNYPTPTASPAPTGGFNTGIFVNSGQNVLVTGTGTWNTGGYGVVTASGIATLGGLDAALRVGSLVGRIGGGNWTAVGSSATLSSSQAGNLYLTMNDTYYLDNSGQITVSAQIQVSTISKVWTGASGINSNASVNSNWQNNLPPTPGDTVIFDGAVSNASCNWDLYSANLALMRLTTGYTGAVTLAPAAYQLTLSNVLEVFGGTFTINGAVTLVAQNNIKVKGALFDLGPGGAVVSVGKLGVLVDNAGVFKDVGTASSTLAAINPSDGFPLNAQLGTLKLANAQQTKIQDTTGVYISSKASLASLSNVGFFNTIVQPLPSLVFGPPAGLTAAFAMSNVFFDVNVSTNVDASQLTAGSTVTVTNASGPHFGSPFDNDPNHVVAWNPDGGGFGTITGNLTNAGGGSGLYTVVAYTAPAGAAPGPMAYVFGNKNGGSTFLKAVNGGPGGAEGGNLGGSISFGALPPYTLSSLPAPNTYYVYAWRDPSGFPTGLSPRGAYGNGPTQGMVANPVFVGAGATASAINLTINDWSAVAGTITMNSSQVGPISADVWVGAPNVAGSTLAAAFAFPSLPQGGATFYTMPAPPTTVQSHAYVVLSTANFSAFQPFEASGSSGPTAAVALSTVTGGSLNITGGGNAPGGALTVGTANPFSFHSGYAGYSLQSPLPQAMMRLDLTAAGSTVTFTALRVDLSTPAPLGGLSMTLWRDANANGLFDNPFLAGFGPFDVQLNSPAAFVPPGVSSAVIVFQNPETINFAQTQTYFVAVDVNGQQVAPFQIRIASTSYFTVSAGSVAAQGIYPIATSSATSKFATLASFNAYAPSSGGLDTSLFVAQGLKVAVSTISGSWNVTPSTTVTAAGKPGTTGQGTIVPAANWGQLIGRIGDISGNGTSWFPVSDGVPFLSSATGHLFLAINDYPGAYFDNSGAVFSTFTLSGSTTGAVSGTITYVGTQTGNLLVVANNPSTACPTCVNAVSTVTLTLAGGTTLYNYTLPSLPLGPPYVVTAVIQNAPSQTGNSLVPFSLISGSTVTGVNFAVSLGSANITGAIGYSGVQTTGKFLIAVATTTDFEHEVTFVAELSTPVAGAYTFAGLPTPATYYIVGFRDVNNNFVPDGPEPFGVVGNSSGAIANLSNLFSPIFLDTATSASGQNIQMIDRGDLSGTVALAGPATNADLVVIVGHGSFGSPGYSVENAVAYFGATGVAGDAFLFDVDLLRPATDYSVFAFISPDLSGVFQPGNQFAFAAPFSVPVGGVTNVNLAMSANVAPSPVPGFLGQPSTTTVVQWTWSAAQGATTYQLLTSTNGLVVALSSTTFSYLNLVATNTFSPITQIKALNAFGAGPAVMVSSVASLASQPGPPVALPVFASSVTLNWATNANSAQTVYQVLRATTSSGPFLIAFSTGGSPAIDFGLLPSAAYFWGVKAVNLNGIASALSSTQAAITNAGAGASVAGAVNYPGNQKGLIQLQVSTMPSVSPVFASIGLPNAPSQSYYVSLPPNATYYLRAFIDVYGDGQPHLGEDITITSQTYVAFAPVAAFDFNLFLDTVPPSNPVGLNVATPLGQDVVTWTAPASRVDGSPLSDLAGFRVYRSTLTPGPFAPISFGTVFGTTATIAGTVFADTAPVPGVTNYYRVTAVNFGSLESRPSASIAVMPFFGGTISGVVIDRASQSQGPLRVRLSTIAFGGGFIAENTLSTFTFTNLGDGTYFVRGFRDLNGNAQQDDNEPGGTLGGLAQPFPVQIFGGNSVTGSTITVCDHTPAAIGVGASQNNVVTISTTTGCPALDQGPGYFTSLLSFRVGGGGVGSVGVGANVFAQMQSAFPNRLILLGPDGSVASQNANPGGAAISYTVNQPGLYFVEPTSFNPFDNGPSTVTISVSGGFSGAIAGTLSYSGGQPTGKFVVQLFTSSGTGVFPILQSTFSAVGAYSIGGLADGQYFVRAYRDVNGNFTQDPGEPLGFFGPASNQLTPVQIQGGVTLVGGASGTPINITLTDPPTGTIAGQILRQGTQTGTIYITATQPNPNCANCNGNLVAFATIPAAGAYTLPFIPPATNYTIASFVDVNGNGKADPLEARGSTQPITVSANATTGVSLLVADPGLGASGNATIQGTVSYGGTSTGPLLMGFATDAQFNTIAYLISQASTGTYLKSGVVGGTSYYIAAFLDTNNNGEPDSKLGEPVGFFGAVPVNDFNSKQPIFVPAAGAVTANVTLGDAPTGSINGQVSYAGAAPLSQNIVIQADVQGGGDFNHGKVVIARSAGVTTYNFTLPFLNAATNYNVSAFVDANGSGQPAFGEPYAQFGQTFCTGTGPCSGSPVAASSGPGTFPTYGVNFTISDPGTSGGNFNSVPLNGSVFYMGIQSGPIVVRLFNNPSYSGAPVLTFSIPAPPGPGNYQFTVPNVPPGTYYVDFFRDTSGTGIYNPTFQAHVAFGQVVVNSGQGSAHTDGPVMTDPGYGGSVNVFSGNFAAAGGARFDGGGMDTPFQIAGDTISIGGPYFYVYGFTDQQPATLMMVKYGPTGVMQSSATFGSGPSNFFDPVVDGNNGFIYLSGSAQPNGNGVQVSTPAIMQLNTSLKVITTAYFTPAIPNWGAQSAQSVRLYNGSLYFGVRSDQTAGAVLRKVNPSNWVTTATGTWTWPAAQCTSNCSGTRVNSIAIDTNTGSVYALFTFDPGGPGRLAAIAKYDASLNLLASKDITGLNAPTGNGSSQGQIIVDGWGDLILSFVASGTSGSVSFYKFNVSLQQMGYTTYAPIVNHFSFGGLRTGLDGFIYSAQEAPVNGGDMLVLRLDQNLNVISSRTFDGMNNTFEDGAADVFVIDSTNVYVTGSVFNGQSVDFATLKLNLTATGAQSGPGVPVAITSANATSAIYGNLYYGGSLISSGTVRASLLPLGSSTALRLSSAPFGASVPYVFNSVPQGNYVIQAFIDANSNFLADVGEPVGLSSSAGFGFTATSNSVVNVFLCDRRQIAQGQTLTDTITSADCPTADRGGAFQRLYTFAGARGQAVTIENDAINFYDSSLRLYDPNNSLVAIGDDSGPGANAKITSFLLPTDGLYTIGASPFGSGLSSATFRLSLGGSAGSLGAIAGNVAYTGVEGGRVLMGLFSTSTFLTGGGVAPVQTLSLAGAGPFNFANLPTGNTYYLGGFVDVNANGRPDPGEDIGFFGSTMTGPAPIFLRSGQNVSGVNFTIAPSSTAVFADISGVVSYLGQQAGALHVELWASSSFQGQPVASRVIPTGVGAYDVLAPGGLPYYIRAWLDAKNDFTLDPTDPVGNYAPHNQGAEAVFTPSSGTIVGINLQIQDPGQLAGGIVGEGAATMTPSTAAAGAQVFSATITYTAGVNGVNPGGKIGFSVPPGFPAPLVAQVTVSNDAGAALSAISTSPVSAFVTVTAGSVPSGRHVTFVYTEGPVACFASTQTFTVAESSGPAVAPQPLFAGSPVVQVVQGPPVFFQPSNPYLSLTQNALSDPQSLFARDLCGNQTPVPTVMGAQTVTLRAKRFDAPTSQFQLDPTVGLTSSTAVSTTAVVNLAFAVGQSSAAFYALSASTGFKNVEVFYNLGAPTTFYYGLTALPGNALSGVSVSTVSFGTGQSSATITPNGGAASVAYINFTLGDPSQSWHIVVSSIPFRPGVPPTGVWESWGYGQPNLGQIAWDGRFSPWINGGARVPSGFYFMRVELAGGGVHDDSVIINVIVPQIGGQVFDSGVAPNPPLAAASVQIYGPNGTIFTQSGANGAYVLPGVAPGVYNMFVSRPDYLNGSLNLTINGAGVVSTFTALTTSVSGSTNAAGGLDVFMSRAAILIVTPSVGVSYSTQSVDLWGSLQVNASTALAVAAQQSYFAALRLPAGTTTFDDGGQWDSSAQQFLVHTTFKFAVSPGTYTVQAALPAFAPSTATINIVSGLNTLALPPLSRKSSISGLVSVPSNPNGLFVSVNAVSFSTSQPGGGAGGVQLPPLSLTGNYTIPNVDVGTYLLTANTNGFAAISSGPIVVPASSDVTHVDFPVFAVGASISGNVTLNADTTGDALQVQINAWAPGTLNFGSTQINQAGGASGLNVPYTINGLTAGATYQLYINVGGVGGLHLEQVGVQPVIVVAPAAAANVSFAVSSGVINGTILLPSGNTDFLNVTLTGQIVASISHPQDVGQTFNIGPSTGLPAFSCFPTGGPASPTGYCPSAPMNSTATFSIQGQGTETTDVTILYTTTGQTKKVRVSSVNGSTTTVFVDLSPLTYSISGSINDQVTNPFFNTISNIVSSAPYIAPLGYPTNISSTTARVVAIKQDLSQFNVAISTVFDPSTSRVGFITNSGAWTIGSVPSGAYFVRTTALRACSTCAVLVPSVGQVVNVAGANVSSVTLTLSDGFSVSGAISLDGGLLDARSFNVVVVNQRQEVVTSTTVYLGDAGLGTTANSVNYAFTNLSAGNFYTLSVADALTPQKYVGRPIKFPNPGLSPNGLQANLTSQNVALLRAAYVTGKLQDANTGQLIGKNNVALLAPNFQIAALSDPWVEGGFALAVSSVSGRPVRADGTFSVGPLIPSIPYDLQLAQQSWDPSFLAQGSQNYTPVALAGLTPQPGQVMDVGVVSLHQGQSLSGSVFASTTTGARLGNIKITAQPTFGTAVGLVVQTYSDQNGRYTLWVSTFVSNQYDVTAAPRDGNVASNGVIYGQVTLGAVNLLATTTADFVLNPLVSNVTGQIVVADAATGGQLSYPFGAQKGFPAAAVFLQPQGVVPTQNPFGDFTTVTDGLGNFAVSGLSTGTFTLRAVSLGYAVFNATVSISTTSYAIYTGANLPANYLAGNVITLTRGAIVRGRIIKSDGSAPNSSEVGGIAAGNFAQGEYLIGGVDVDPSARTVNSYTISGFKPGIAYNIVILPASRTDDTVFPPEGSGVTFLPQESTTTKNINLTFGSSQMICFAKGKALAAAGQFQIKIDCNKDLRNTLASDNDLSQLLTISTYTSNGAAIIAPNGTGQMLGGDKQIAANRRELTAIYRIAAGETSFSVRLRAVASTVNPQTGANFSTDQVFDFFAGLGSNTTNRVTNINGGVIQIEPSQQDEQLGLNEQSHIDLQPGTFALGADSLPDSAVVASETTTVTVGIAKATDQKSASVLALKALGYVPSSLNVLGNPSAFPSELAAAMTKYGVLGTSTNTVGGANPLSSFYSIFLPLGVRHQLKQRADLTFSYSTANSTSTTPDKVNVYFYNATLGQFVLENTNRRVDTTNKTITVSVNHFSVFVVLDGQPQISVGTPFPVSDIMAFNFPNPSDCGTHSNIARDTRIFGAGATFPPFVGPMIRYSLPSGDVEGATIRIYNIAGQLVKSIDQGTVNGGTTNYFPWNCTNNSGRPVASGVYIGEVQWGTRRKFFKIAIIRGSGL